MKKGILLFSAMLMVLAIGVFISWVSEIDPHFEEEWEEENEERPDQPLMSDEEMALFKEYLQSREQSGNSNARTSETSVYADGKISGKWSPKVTRSGWYGYRVDNAAYDSLRDVFYVVTYAGHLYKLEYASGVKWTLLNHKVVMNPANNSLPNPIFFGVHLADQTFRLIRSNDDMGRMEYSDDEGRTWTNATGAGLAQSFSNQGFVVNDEGHKRIVVHTYNSGYHNLYFSDDFGATYKLSTANRFAISTWDMRMTKSFFSDDAYMYVWNKSTKKVKTYKYDATANDFVLSLESSSVVQGTNLSNVAATYVDGKMHFYLGTINTTYTVYYSSDYGVTWTQKVADRDRPFETISPKKPNILFSGFEDMKLSTDYGATWTGFGWRLGWDLQYMGTFEKAGGKSITLAGLDFGCYVSETPEDKESYTWCNDGAWYALHYDAASDENFNSVYLGNQDRGTTAYSDSGDTVSTIDVDGTDVLRVAYANQGMGAWSWFYYGRIRHRYNFALGKSATTVYDGLGNWWAAPMIPSPDPKEDAIYVPAGSNLQIFKYSEASNSISKTAHPFDFKTKFGSEIGGFGYSELDRNLWYVALNNGIFLYSEDAGVTWAKSGFTGQKPRANDQSYNYPKNQIVIKASAIDTSRVYYAGVDNVFLISEDGGKTFTIKTTGLNIYRMRDFALSPDEKFVFAACGYQGAWVLDVEVGKWYQMSDDPIPTVDFTDVEFIKGTNVVRFGTFGSGILELKLDQVFNPLTAPAELTATIQYASRVELSWTDRSDDEDGFYIERSTNGEFKKIGLVVANQTSFIDENASFGQTYYYRVQAFKGTDLSYKSNLLIYQLPKEGYLTKNGWQIIDFSSQEEANRMYARYAIDNNESTIWHTQWDGAQPKHPHHIAIDLGKEQAVSGFAYLPRQDGLTNGGISNYEFYVSNDPDDWGTSLVTGKFGSGSGRMQTSTTNSKKGRYVKVVALNEINGQPYTSAAEIDVLYYNTIPNSPVNLQANLAGDREVLVSWQDNEAYELGYIIEQLDGQVYKEVGRVNGDTYEYLISGLQEEVNYTYRVRSFNQAGISAGGGVAMVFVPKVVLSASAKQAFRVYPNPASDIISIEWPAKWRDGAIRVLNLEGKVLITQAVKDTQVIKLSLGSLNRGIYLVEISSGQNRLVQRVKKG